MRWAGKLFENFIKFKVSCLWCMLAYIRLTRLSFSITLLSYLILCVANSDKVVIRVGALAHIARVRRLGHQT